MIFKRREHGAKLDVIGEARVVDPGDDARPIEGEAIEVVTGAAEVAPTAIIGRSIIIRGDVSGDEDLIVEGRVEGRVDLPASRLTIGAEGDLAADVAARALKIEGQIKGDVSAVENVVLASGGTMVGNINAPRITLEDGCIFNGTIAMVSEPVASVTDLKTPQSAASGSASADKHAV